MTFDFGFSSQRDFATHLLPIKWQLSEAGTTLHLLIVNRLELNITTPTQISSFHSTCSTNKNLQHQGSIRWDQTRESTSSIRVIAVQHLSFQPSRLGPRFSNIPSNDESALFAQRHSAIGLEHAFVPACTNYVSYRFHSKQE